MIRLVENKVAIDPIFDSDYSPSGLLIIPEEAKDRCDQGIIKYIGPEVKDYQIGQYVLFPGHTGTLMRLEGEGLLIIMREEFITCEILPPNTDIPGLFFRDATGEYWPATYEMATTLIARQFQDMNLIEKIEHKDKLKPQRAGS